MQRPPFICRAAYARPPVSPCGELKKSRVNPRTSPRVRSVKAVESYVLAKKVVEHNGLADTTVLEGLHTGDDTFSDCFFPRHGIRASVDGEVHEWVICFQCSPVKWYVDGKSPLQTAISDEHQDFFNTTLLEAGVPLENKDYEPGDYFEF